MSDSDSMSASDRLVVRIRENDTDALAEYIEMHRPQLEGFIAKNMSDALSQKVEPSDILSEVAISAISTLEEMDLSEREPFSWLCQLSERRIIDAFRRHIDAQKRSSKKEVGLDAPAGGDGDKGFVDMLVASMTSPSAAFSRGAKEFRLQVVVAQLPEEQREAIRMRYIEGRPTKEIADHLGKSDGAIRVMLTRTLGRLQHLLGDETLFKSYIQE